MTSLPTWVRACIAGALGVLIAVAFTPLIGVALAMAAGWIGLALVYVVWTFWVILPMSPQQTASHSTGEDPGRATSAAALTLASIASVAGVIVLLGSTQSSTVPLDAILGVAAVVSSWLLVHTLFTVRYARLYHQDPRPAIDFSGDEPDYHDFAYLAFTLGMTYQVSDTTLRNREMRRAVLQHALLSYLLGAVVLACTINLVVQLASS